MKVALVSLLLVAQALAFPNHGNHGGEALSGNHHPKSAAGEDGTLSHDAVVGGLNHQMDAQQHHPLSEANRQHKEHHDGQTGNGESEVGKPRERRSADKKHTSEEVKNAAPDGPSSHNLFHGERGNVSMPHGHGVHQSESHPHAPAANKENGKAREKRAPRRHRKNHAGNSSSEEVGGATGGHHPALNSTEKLRERRSAQYDQDQQQQFGQGGEGNGGHEHAGHHAHNANNAAAAAGGGQHHGGHRHQGGSGDNENGEIGQSYRKKRSANQDSSENKANTNYEGYQPGGEGNQGEGQQQQQHHNGKHHHGHHQGQQQNGGSGNQDEFSHGFGGQSESQGQHHPGHNNGGEGGQQQEANNSGY